MKKLIIALMFISLGAIANDASEKEVQTSQLVKLLIKNASQLDYELKSKGYIKSGNDITDILSSALSTGANTDENAVAKKMTSVCHGITPEGLFGAKIYNCLLSVKTEVINKPELNHTIVFDLTVEQAWTARLSEAHIIDNSVIINL